MEILLGWWCDFFIFFLAVWCFFAILIWFCTTGWRKVCIKLDKTLAVGVVEQAGCCSVFLKYCSGGSLVWVLPDEHQQESFSGRRSSAHCCDCSFAGLWISEIGRLCPSVWACRSQTGLTNVPSVPLVLCQVFILAISHMWYGLPANIVFENGVLLCCLPNLLLKNKPPL